MFRKRRREATLTTVADAMTARTASVGPNATLQEASAAMLEAGVQEAVVLDGGKPVGLVSAETIAEAMAIGLDVTTGRARAAAAGGLVVVRADESLLEAHERMRAAGRRSAVVVGGDDGSLVGLLTDATA